MKTLHLGGYHDSFIIKVDQLKDEPCFAKGTFYLAEMQLDSSTIDLFNNAKNRYELERRLINSGLCEIASSNIASLLDLQPSGIMPCATRTSDDGSVYGSQRDIEIKSLIKKAIEILPFDNITFFGGSKHAKYTANELDYPHKILYDFRYEQKEYNPLLKSIMIRDKII